MYGNHKIVIGPSLLSETFALELQFLHSFGQSFIKQAHVEHLLFPKDIKRKEKLEFPGLEEVMSKRKLD